MYIKILKNPIIIARAKIKATTRVIFLFINPPQSNYKISVVKSKLQVK